jgi:hypothetical protein
MSTRSSALESDIRKRMEHDLAYAYAELQSNLLCEIILNQGIVSPKLMSDEVLVGQYEDIVLSYDDGDYSPKRILYTEAVAQLVLHQMLSRGELDETFCPATRKS